MVFSFLCNGVIFGIINSSGVLFVYIKKGKGYSTCIYGKCTKSGQKLIFNKTEWFIVYTDRFFRKRILQSLIESIVTIDDHGYNSNFFSL